MMNHARVGWAAIKARMEPVCQPVVGVQDCRSALIVNQTHHHFLQVPVRPMRPSSALRNRFDGVRGRTPQFVAGFFQLTSFYLTIHQFQKVPALRNVVINSCGH